mgnify:CR=1 FL=1
MARTGRQRAASRRNLAKARAAKQRQGDSFFGYFGRMALSASVSAATGGKGKAISDFIEGKGTPGQIRARKKAKKAKRQARIAKKNTLKAMVKK